MQTVSLRELTKTFSGVRAVDHVTVEFHAGEIHAVLGENGAGKSTLMHLLSGLYRPDSGEIYLDGKPHQFPSARASLASGIAMVHQHFMLVPTLTIAENILLTLPGSPYDKVRKAELSHFVSGLAAQYGITLEDPNAPVSTLSVGSQQRVEILKALATNARVLILDEPTAVLTPNEVTSLFDSLRKLKSVGYLILLITHKIPEVLAISDRLSLLRRGRLITTRETHSCAAIELASLMVEDVDSAQSPPSIVEKALENKHAQENHNPPLLALQHLSVANDKGRMLLQNISLTLHAGEIIGIAGVDGNGQTELTEVLIGLRSPSAGSLYLKGQNLVDQSPAKRRAAGIALIPQDRRREGLATSLTIAENLLLNAPLLANFTSGAMLSPHSVDRFAAAAISRFSIRTPNARQLVSTLSGGNQQRVVIAREFSTPLKVIIAANPCRGLDIGATQYIYQQLRQHQTNGAGVILISTDLDEILSLSTRVYTLYQGQLLGPVAPSVNREQLGQMMGGVWKDTA
jgi:general nucleoside transport system ATP-binding protein